MHVCLSVCMTLRLCAPFNTMLASSRKQLQVMLKSFPFAALKWILIVLIYGKGRSLRVYERKFCIVSLDKRLRL